MHRKHNPCTSLCLRTDKEYSPVSPEIYEKIYADILEQTENLKKYSD